MTKIELGKLLKDMYNNASDGEAVAMIHLFGIKYSTEIKNGRYSAKEIAIAAGISEKYGTEINKGIKLSTYVKVRS